MGIYNPTEGTRPRPRVMLPSGYLMKQCKLFPCFTLDDVNDVCCRDPEHRCKLSCFNRIKQSYYTTPENVLDGTPCSYEHPSNMCVQGKCVAVGCDRILGSPLQEDMCGICGGDGSKCAVQAHTARKRINRDFSKVMVVPRGARRLEVSTNSTEVAVNHLPYSL